MSNRHTVIHLSFGAILAIIGLSVSMLSYAQDATSSSSAAVASSSSSLEASSSSSTVSSSFSSFLPSFASSNSSSATSAAFVAGPVTMTVQQEIDGQTDFAMLGSWVLSKPDYTQQSGTNAQSNISNATPGNYTIFSDVPEGMTAVTLLYRNGVEETVISRAQLNFKANSGDTIRVVLRYKLTNVGKVSVQSDPPGMKFTLSGPNKSKFSGITPVSYEVAPAGQYSVVYESLPDCPRLPAKSLQLEGKSRIQFFIELTCKGADDLRANPPKISSSSSSKASTSILTGNLTSDVANSTSSTASVTAPLPATASVITPGQMIDVPPNSWFAPYVYKAIQRGILKGYNDENGQPNGMFGPTNLVTVAEMSAIAHRLGNLNENEYGNVPTSNTGALNQWFTTFFSSAEQRGWAMYQDPYLEIDRPVSRAEVVQTFLQVLDIPLEWPKGKKFADVPLRHKYAAAIETAAKLGYVEGRGDGKFVPEDPINRAELSKIIDRIFGDKE